MIDVMRRDFLALPAALALSAQLYSSAATAMPVGTGSGSLDFDDPQVNLDSTIRIYGSTDGTVRYNIGYGRAFALFDGELAVPLFDAKALQWLRFDRRADGSYDRRTGFAQLHDRVGAQTADGWRNPVTGESIKLPVFTNDFNEAHYTIAGTATPPAMEVRSNEIPGEPRVYPWIVLNDDVWLAKEDFATYFSKREGRRLTENATRTYHTSLRALMAKAPSVPATMVESALSEMFAWMNMPKDKKGVMLWRFTSKKYGHLSGLPKALVADMAARAPGFMKELPVA